MRRTFHFMMAGIALAFTTMVTGQGAAAVPSAGDLDGGAAAGCLPLASVSARPIYAPGSTASQPAGNETTYQLPDGGTLSSLSPPDGFDPRGASAAALAAFHLPPRPTGGAALARWDAMWPGPLHEAGADHPCLSNNAGVSDQSPNWSGRVDTGSGFRDVFGYFTVPTFSVACPHNSDDFMWDGLGGWTSSGVIQAGVDTRQSGVHDLSATTEVYPKENEIYHSVPAISEGNRMYIESAYVTPDAEWNIYNLTTHDYRTFSEGSISSYYSGSSAEYIDERSQNKNLTNYVDDHYYYYRKHTDTAWDTEYIDGITAGSRGTADLHVYMWSNSAALKLGTTSFSGVSNSANSWQHCPGE